MKRTIFAILVAVGCYFLLSRFVPQFDNIATRIGDVQLSWKIITCLVAGGLVFWKAG